MREALTDLCGYTKINVGEFCCILFCLLLFMFIGFLVHRAFFFVCCWYFLAAIKSEIEGSQWEMPDTGIQCGGMGECVDCGLRLLWY